MKITWSSRLNETLYLPQKVHVSVDGTDCQIQEPSPFDSKWFSHKFRGPGVRYEIGVSIITGNIVWINGPFECGSYPDIKIFKNHMLNCLTENEHVVADDGYINKRCVNFHHVDENSQGLHKLIRARHEAVNERLKNFNVIRHIFRHSLDKHGYCFHAVGQITALMLMNTNPMFKVL